MSIVTNIVTPIVTGVVIIFFCFWILFLLYKGMTKLIPNFKFIMIYKVFRKKWDEEAVNWCMDAINKDVSKIGAEKLLLVKKIKKKKVKEIMYIYNQVLNKLEGGGKHEQLRQSNEQTQFPEIKES